MAVTRSELEHIASLARLALDEKRVPELLEQLNAILGHMDVLSRVDTRAVGGELDAGAAGLPLREDEGDPIPLHRRLEEFAPAMRDGLFVVPRLASHESLGEDAE